MLFFWGGVVNDVKVHVVFGNLALGEMARQPGGMLYRGTALCVQRALVADSRYLGPVVRGVNVLDKGLELKG